MFCAINCISVRFSCLTLSSQCRSSDYTFFSPKDCPSYDSPVLQFRFAIQKEGEKPAPGMDTHISLHLTARVASICGGRRSWKCWARHPLCNPSSPSPPVCLLPVSTCSPAGWGRSAGLARAAPALPATHNLLHSAETKRHAGKTPINSTETRRERK